VAESDKSEAKKEKKKCAFDREPQGKQPVSNAYRARKKKRNLKGKGKI